MSEATETSEPTSGWPAAILLAATFFVATAPTLSWLEFASGMENLVVATSLEIRRTEHWLLPELEGEPRVAKPPLAAWISAATIRCATDIALDSSDPEIRAAAYRRLAWELRWPGLAASCLMLLGIFDLGRTVAGARGGLLAMAVAGSTLYFFRFGRQATTDVQLALWASVANAALARFCLRRVTWRAALVAGAALGLGMMSKGPVVLLQTLLPVAIFMLWQRANLPRLRVAPIVVMFALMLVVGLSWYVWVLVQYPETWSRWMIELSRAGPANRSGNVLSYASLFLYMMPWTPLFVHGLIWTGMEVRSRERRERWTLVFVLIVVPVAVMSFFPDRKERYLLPLLGPCAVLTARSLELTLSRLPTGPKIPPWVQWMILLAIGISVPIAGATKLLRIDGQPWYSIGFASATAALMLLLMVAGWVWSRRHPAALVGATVVVMLMLQPLVNYGYRESLSGRSDMRPLAELIRQAYPDAEMFNWRPDSNKRAPVDLSIYLNRSTVWTPDPMKLPPSTRPQICIKLQNAGEPEPLPPAGWGYVAKVKRDKDHYLAFVRQGER
jgi:4-amino-4-deoxy-L-arabinose transferase-like glycosyltransferase